MTSAGNPTSMLSGFCCTQMASPWSYLINTLCCKQSSCCRCSIRHSEFQNEELLKRVIAIYDYDAVGSGEISMKKGDFLLVIDEKDTDWWKVSNSGKTGFIPSSYVASTTANEIEDWYFGDTNRKEAEKLLEQRGLERGVFLIRKSEKKGMYALSVRDTDSEYDVAVKHYQIRPVDEGGYYISADNRFKNLRQLVAHYSEGSNGLCHRLVRSCQKPKPHIWELSPETKDFWEVDRNMIRLIKILGGGSFGDVWLAKWQENISVAVKSVKPGTMSKEEFLREAAVMKQLRHPNLVSLYAVCSEEPIYIITEFMPHGCLLDYLRKHEEIHLRVLIYMAAQIASGMMYLEQKELVHRDLAARNILLGLNDVVKICDFGMARILEDKIYSASNTKAPIKWTAPEALTKLQFTTKSDVWSFGILLMEIITYGEIPYAGMSNPETIDFVRSGHRMSKPRNCPDVIYQFMLQCWEERPQQRPTFEFLYTSLDEYLISADTLYSPADQAD